MVGFEGGKSSGWRHKNPARDFVVLLVLGSSRGRAKWVRLLIPPNRTSRAERFCWNCSPTSCRASGWFPGFFFSTDKVLARGTSVPLWERNVWRTRQVVEGVRGCSGFRAFQSHKPHKDRLSFGDNVVPIISIKMLQAQHKF